MTTIAEKLVLLNSTKTAIANAIEAKGVTVGAVPFADYAAKIADITSGGSTPEPTPEPNITPWVRPDWPALPTLVEGNQRFVGVHAVYAAGSNFCALSAAGNYTVDWGDGVVENYVSNVVAYHTYDFTNVNLSAATSRGYKCAIVSLTPQSGQSLTTLKLHQKHNQANLGMYSSGFLDIAIAGQSLSDLRIGIQTPGSTTQVIRFADLEQVQVISSNAITNFSNMFYNCYSLQSIPLLNTAAGTNLSYMFYGCYSLQTIPLLNTAANFNFSFMFYNCYSLQSIPLLNTAVGTNFSGMFYYCHSLQSIPLLNTAAGNTFSSMFYSCHSLQSIPLLNTAAGTSFSNMFYSCYSLKSIPLLNTAANFNFLGMFYYCYSLQSIPLLNTAAGTDFSNMFGNCYSLQSTPLLNTAAGTNLSYMFYGCTSLKSIPLLNTAAGTNFSYMFYYCYSLQSIPLLNTAAGTNFSNMFYNCYSLSNIDATGFKVSFSVSGCKLSAAALNKIYTNLPTVSVKTITVSSNWGTATDNPSIATAKGWTVSG